MPKTAGICAIRLRAPLGNRHRPAQRLAARQAPMRPRCEQEQTNPRVETTSDAARLGHDDGRFQVAEGRQLPQSLCRSTPYAHADGLGLVLADELPDQLRQRPCDDVIRRPWQFHARCQPPAPNPIYLLATLANYCVARRKPGPPKRPQDQPLGRHAPRERARRTRRPNALVAKLGPPSPPTRGTRARHPENQLSSRHAHNEDTWHGRG